MEHSPKWLNRYDIVDPEHVQDLETRAAIHEFGNKKPRDEAEQTAHKEYIKERRTEAAAHHLAGQKAAMAAGDRDSAEKHGILYSLHVKALDHNPIDAVPAEVANKAKDVGKLYRFKPHKGDMFALGSDDK